MFENAEKFLPLFFTVKPDFVVLDVQVPDGDGMEVARVIRQHEPSLPILFLTGYADYAAESYLLDATDYILKPIDPERVLRAVEKVKKQLRQLDDPWKRIEKALQSPGKISIKQEESLVFLEIDQIVFVQKE